MASHGIEDAVVEHLRYGGLSRGIESELVSVTRFCGNLIGLLVGKGLLTADDLESLNFPRRIVDLVPAPEDEEERGRERAGFNGGRGTAWGG